MGFLDDIVEDMTDIIKDRYPLVGNYDSYNPNEISFRDRETRALELAVFKRPLQHPPQTPKNLYVWGRTSTGKTTVIRRLIQGLNEKKDDNMGVFYTDCERVSSLPRFGRYLTSLVGLNMGKGYRIGRYIDAFLREIEVQYKSLVLVLDNIDCLSPHRFKEVNRVVNILTDPGLRETEMGVVLVSNNLEFENKLSPETLTNLEGFVYFKEYARKEVQEIIRERCEVALIEGTWDEKMVRMVAKGVYKWYDIWQALGAIENAAVHSEDNGKEKIGDEELTEAIKLIKPEKKKLSRNRARRRRFRWNY